MLENVLFFSEAGERQFKGRVCNCPNTVPILYREYVVADMAQNITVKSTKTPSFPNGWPYRIRYCERLVRRDNSLFTHISTYEQLSKRLLHYQTYYYITYEQALKNRSTNFWRKISAPGGVAEPKILTKNICPIRDGNFVDRTRRNIFRKMSADIFSQV